MPNSVSPPNLAPLLGARRKALGLTLEALAGRSGVSRSMLSQIERGEANPTFSTLWNITHALDLTIADLVYERIEETAIELVADRHTPEMRTEDGRCVLRILNPADAAGHTEWYLLTMEPGGSLESSPHAVGSTEHLTVLEGEIVIEAGAGSATVIAGGTARYPVDVAHLIRAGSSGARALLVVMNL